MLFAPALWLALPSMRRRWQFTAATGGLLALLFVSMPLTVGTPVGKLPYLARIMSYYHPPIGTWGWAGVWVAFHPTRLSTTVDPLWINAGSYARNPPFRRPARGAAVAARPPPRYRDRDHDRAAAITPAFGTQYPLWQAPTCIAYPSPLAIPLQIVLGAYAAMLYLPMSMLTSAHWHSVDKIMMVVSLGVIALTIAALPWGREVPCLPTEEHPMPECTTDPATA